MIADTRDYMGIVEHYERCLDEYATGPRAVNWNSQADAKTRYRVMHDLFAHERSPVSVLDFGCGLGGFKDYLQEEGASNIVYEGLDVSPAFVSAARKSHPDSVFHCVDLLDEEAVIPEYDYAVMNGIFTRRAPLSHADMLAYMERLAGRLFTYCRKGIAFNVMSSCVDWKSEELFYPAPGELFATVERALSRHFHLRNDYGLHETTIYAYKQPRR